MFLKVDINLLWTVVNLGILYLLARKFLFKPLRSVMSRRQELINQQMDDASKAKIDAQKIKEQGEQWLAQAHKEANNLMDTARDRADEAYDEIVSAARTEAKHVREEMRVKLAHEEADARERVSASVRDLALLAASKLASRNMTSEDDRALIDAYCREEQ